MRKSNWPELLAGYVESKRHEPFKWGANDCALFAKGAAEVILSESPTATIKHRYRSQKGAAKHLADVGCADLWEFVDKHFKQIPITMIKRGDWVGHMTTDKSIGVCLGSMYATPSDAGLVFAPLTDVLIAWSVE